MIEYLGEFLMGPRNWLNHFEKSNKYLDNEEKNFVRRRVRKSRVDRFFPVIQKMSEDMVGIKTEKITKNLVVDFAAAVKIIDDYIDQKENNVEIIYKIFEDLEDIHPRLKTVKKWLDSINESIEDKYEVFEKYIPIGIEAVISEMNVQDESDAMEATKKSGELGMDFIADLIEVYSGKDVSNRERKGLKSIGFMGNLLDDVADMREDYGVRKTYPLLLYEKYKATYPKQKAKKLAVKESKKLAEKIYRDGMKNVERKDVYRLLGNMIKFKYSIIARKKLKKF